ncbi:lipase [Ancylothrix sp. C2]|nr:lipase [Ancylothrix sp. D3o]
MNNSQKANPILLLHGLWDTEAIFHPMSNFLSKLGYSVYSLSMNPNNGDVALEKLAEQVAIYAAKIFPENQRFDLLGFSMGGIVGRYYLQRLGGIEKVDRFITIGSPHNGTATAFGSLRPGCMQMRIGSYFLADLNRDLTVLSQINFTSIWSPYDMMILPASSSIMPVGKNILIPVLFHGWMAADERVLKAVMEELSAPLKAENNRLNSLKTTVQENRK